MIGGRGPNPHPQLDLNKYCTMRIGRLEDLPCTVTAPSSAANSLRSIHEPSPRTEKSEQSIKQYKIKKTGSKWQEWEEVMSVKGHHQRGVSSQFCVPWHCWWWWASPVWPAAAWVCAACWWCPALAPAQTQSVSTTNTLAITPSKAFRLLVNGVGGIDILFRGRGSSFWQWSHSLGEHWDFKGGQKPPPNATFHGVPAVWGTVQNLRHNQDSFFQGQVTQTRQLEEDRDKTPLSGSLFIVGLKVITTTLQRLGLCTCSGCDYWDQLYAHVCIH